jgi:hypothetical protein
LLSGPDSLLVQAGNDPVFAGAENQASLFAAYSLTNFPGLFFILVAVAVMVMKSLSLACSLKSHLLFPHLS